MTSTEALAFLAAQREKASGPAAEILDVIAAEVERTGDPAAIADRVLFLIGAEA
ncbi:hypothetical protein [Streptomyces sp. NPDC008141]|uniref:hypothetical protein n=1 Tax=Streptomyces sp. NPDC008141 TaxID=3364815 RepID=UPI0036E169C2